MFSMKIHALFVFVLDVGGLTVDVPPDWQDFTQRGQLAAAEFCLPTADEFARVTIQFLGKAREGLEQRLKSNFDPPQGKKIGDVTTTESITTAAATVKLIQLRGTFRYFALITDRGRAPVGEKPVSCLSQNLPVGAGSHRPGDKHMMVAAIVDTPKGPYVISLVGPEKAVAMRKRDFVSWLKTFRKNSN